MIAMPLPERRFMQVCWVVPDLHQAIERWISTNGVGPWFLFEKVEWANARYRGQPFSGVHIDAAIAQSGDTQIELLVQHGDAPSMIREFIPEGNSGLHHMALYCSDFASDLAFYRAAGAEVIFEGQMLGEPVCWLDTAKELGFLVELATANPRKQRVFDQFRAAATSWDGRDPIRRIS